MVKYGDVSPLRNKEIRKKIRKTCLEKYGVDNPYKSEEIKLKITKILLEKYGISNPMESEFFKNKIKNTCLERYRYQSASSSQVVQEKTKKTCLEKYGYAYATQNEDVQAKIIKNSFKSKNFTMPSGKIIKVQGFEPFAISLLLDSGIAEEDIVSGVQNVPKIMYYDNSGKIHRYFCDIFIPSVNLIIEVKSRYTFETKKEINILKHNASIKSGYYHVFFIFDKNQNLNIVE